MPPIFSVGRVRLCQEVWNLSTPSVTVHARTANGNVAPLRTLAGAATTLNNPVGLAVDTVNNEMAVANIPGSVTVYTRTANGNVAPLRTLSGAATGLNAPLFLAITTGAAPPSAAIPTLSEWAQIGMALLLVAVAVWHLRRRRPLGTA